MVDDARYMALALQLAAKGLYTTQPNPRVGCVIVNNDTIIGEGYHLRAGEPHAEIHALGDAHQRAPGQIKGATAYVTLEPCSHQGKTPPCANALIEAGVSRVVVAMEDPNPLVAGQGIARLRKVGIQVDVGVGQADAEALNPGFIQRMRSGRPWVRVKMAMSLDGRTAMASGESQWITGEAARLDVQKWRARSCAILTGSGTVIADNPRMNVRIAAEDLGVSGTLNQPLRVIVDSQLKTPSDAGMLNDQAPVLIATTSATEQHAQNANVNYWQGSGDRVDLNALLTHLGERQINEVHVEAGAGLCGALLEADRVDEMIIYMAPHIMGDSAMGLFHLPALQHMNQRVALSMTDVRAIGQDWRITARPTR